MIIQIRHLIFRYGVFILLIFMTTGMLCFVSNFELRNKTSIHLFYDSCLHCWHGYIDNRKSIDIQPNDTILVVQTSMGDISYIVEHIISESNMLHMTLLPTKKVSFSNTYSEGFIYIGKEKIIDKILKNTLP